MITLAHINIRTGRYEQTVAFYEALLDFRRAISPVNPDPDKNMWLLDATGNPCIHVNALGPDEPQRSGESCLDHVAFDCADKERVLVNLHRLQIPFTEVQTRVPQVIQINLQDPNGIRVELTFGHEFLSPRPVGDARKAD